VHKSSIDGVGVGEFAVHLDNLGYLKGHFTSSQVKSRENIAEGIHYTFNDPRLAVGKCC
jgi:hypothetical protein